MSQETVNPGALAAAGAQVFIPVVDAGEKHNIRSAARLQVARLERPFLRSAARAALIAPLVFGEP